MSTRTLSPGISPHPDTGADSGGPCAFGAPEVRPDRFREVFGRLPTGVTVVTTGGLAGLAGLTASSVTSVSLDPLLILVCIHSGSASLRVLLDNGRFVVNVLGDTQAWVSSRFAERLPSPEKFAPLP